MQQKAKANSVVTHRIEGERVMFNVLGVGELTLDLAKVAPINRKRAEFHGWIQRVVDAAAVGRTDESGNIIPKERLAAMKYHAMNEVITHYEGGSEVWAKRATGGIGVDRSLTIRAVAAVKGMTEEAVRASVETKAKALNVKPSQVLEVLRQSPAVKAKMEELSPPVDSAAAESLLDALQ